MFKVLELHATLELDEGFDDVRHPSFGVGSSRKLPDLRDLEVCVRAVRVDFDGCGEGPTTDAEVCSSTHGRIHGAKAGTVLQSRCRGWECRVNLITPPQRGPIQWTRRH